MSIIPLVAGRLISVIFIVAKHSFFTKESSEIKLRLILENLGSVFVKLGQILAMRLDLLPQKYALALWDLFDSESPIPNEEMFFIFKKETGREIKDIFEEIEEKPLAVASFGQVYKARLKGEKVVIKILKPGVETYIRADMIVLKFLALILDSFGLLRAITVKEIIRQLENWLKEELDYRIEARNAEIIYEHALRKHRLADVVVPKIYPEYAAKRVLVQEFIEGYPANKLLLALEKNPEKTRKILIEKHINLAKIADDFLVDLMRQYFIDGFFHADPHPANLMILPHSKIGYVDFGIVGRPEHGRIPLLKFIKAAAEQDFESGAKNFCDFGYQVLAPDIEILIERNERYFLIYNKIFEFIAKKLLSDIKYLLEEWYLNSGNPALSPAKRSSAVVFFKIIREAEKYKIKLPLEAIAFFRALAIIDMVCIKLNNNFSMPEAIKLFFARHNIREIEKIVEEHFEEKEELIAVDYAKSAEETEEIRLKEKEKYYILREKFQNLVAFLIEKYPELREEIKGLM